jgi:PAS domain S-box-containing protein
MFQLRRYFSLTSAIALLFSAVLLVGAYRWDQTEEHVSLAAEENLRLADAFVAAFWPQFAPMVARLSTIPPEQLRERRELRAFDVALRNLVTTQPIIKIKIYDAKGDVIYSPIRSEVGPTASAKPALKAALAGQPSTNSGFREAISGFEGEVRNRHVVETYRPLMGSDGGVKGVFELYSDMTAAQERLQTSLYKASALIFACFAALYGALLLVVRRADTILDSHRRNLVDSRHLLHEQKEMLQSLLNAAGEGIFGTDTLGRVSFINPAALRMIGYTAEDVVGKDIHTLLHHSHPDGTPRHICDCEIGKARIEQRVTENRNDYFWRRDGTCFPVEYISTPVSNISEPGGTVVLFRDVTERMEAEQALRNSNQELQNFAYVASHDLQEPLRMVTSYLMLLQRRYSGQLDSEADEFIDFAVDGARRMQRLITDLLTYARVTTHGKTPAPADLDRILNDTMANLAPRIEERGATVSHDPLPIIVCDDGQVARLFQNLIGNALKYCRGDVTPAIHIGAVAEGDQMSFYVRDNGIGIAAEFHDRIFVIFQRLHDRSTYDGTGIGLAECKRIVERHGGRIWLESRPGVGSTFWFTLSGKQRGEHVMHHGGGGSHHVPAGGHGEPSCLPGHCERGAHAHFNEHPRRHETVH